MCAYKNAHAYGYKNAHASEHLFLEICMHTFLTMFFCSETAYIRAEVLEIEVETLTKEIVEGACVCFRLLPACVCVCVLICLHADVRLYVPLYVRLSKCVRVRAHASTSRQPWHAKRPVLYMCTSTQTCARTSLNACAQMYTVHANGTPGRASNAAAAHQLRGLLDDLSRCAAEAGEVHAVLCIGLEAVVMDSEENTHEVLLQHKNLLCKLVQETQARQAAEEALSARMSLDKKGRTRGSGAKDDELQRLRSDLKGVCTCVRVCVCVAARGAAGGKGGLSVSCVVCRGCDSEVLAHVCRC